MLLLLCPSANFHNNTVSIISWGQSLPSKAPNLNTQFMKKGNNRWVTVSHGARLIERQTGSSESLMHSNRRQHYHSEWSPFSHHALLSIWQQLLWGQRRQDTQWCELRVYYVTHTKWFSPKMRQPAIEKRGTSAPDGWTKIEISDVPFSTQMGNFTTLLIKLDHFQYSSLSTLRIMNHYLRYYFPKMCQKCCVPSCFKDSITKVQNHRSSSQACSPSVCLWTVHIQTF